MEKTGNVLIKVMQDLSKLSTNGSAHVRVNSNICEPETFQALFNHFSRGTILDRLDLEVESLEPYVDCSCGHQEQVEGDHPGYSNCPSCGRFAEVKDSSYQLVRPDPEKTDYRRSIRF